MPWQRNRPCVQEKEDTRKGSTRWRCKADGQVQQACRILAWSWYVDARSSVRFVARGASTVYVHGEWNSYVKRRYEVISVGYVPRCSC